MEEVAGLLLTGGASRRMGRDKASLRVGGRALGQSVADVIAASVSGPVIEVGPGRTTLPAVADAGIGPLGALVAGGRALRDRGHDGPFVAIACDLPRLTVELVTRLAEQAGTAVPVVGGRAQPLCARYQPDAVDVATRLAGGDDRSLMHLLDQLPVIWLDEAWWSAFADARVFDDVDTPADLDCLGS